MKRTATAVALSMVMGSAGAALVDRGGGMIYDEAQGITWLEDWNANGLQQPWATQKAWAENLVWGGFSDWVLPSIDQYVALWAEVGSTFGGLQASFTNVQSDNFYWSGTEFTPGSEAWFFLQPDGTQRHFDEIHVLYAVAVRPGDVALVPEPHSLLLVLMALSAAAVASRRLPR